MGAVVTGLVGSRFGLAGVVAVLMGLAIGVQTMRLSWSEEDGAKKDATIAARDATIAEQNAAVEKMRSDALARSQAAADRARVALKPRPKPATGTIKDLNAWISGNP